MGMEYFALFLEKEGRLHEKQMLDSLKQSNVLENCYAYKSRVKTEEKLLEKLKIKLEEGKEGYSLKDITDVIGLRLVTLFRVDMVNSLEEIVKIIKHDSNLSPNPFKKDSLEEVIFYTNRKNDSIKFSLKDLAVKLCIEEIFKVKEVDGEYSSIHIVTRINKKLQKMSTSEFSYFLPVEIQIRTVFEDAWGEVDHKYGYSIKKGKKVDFRIRNPQSILRHLDTLKRFSDACGEYADAIHLEVVHDSTEDLDIVTVVSVTSDQETIDFFKEIEIPKEHIEKYINGRKLREEAIAIKTQSNGSSLEKFLMAASIFKELSEKYLDECGKIKSKYFFYYSRMNYAFCLLSTNSKKEASDALHVYEELEEQYPEFILLKMRMAQAYGKNRLIDLSLKKCEVAYSMYKEVEKNGFVVSKELPEADWDHIRKHLPKIYGYYLWMKCDTNESESFKNSVSKVMVLRKAYNLTKEALANDSENNSLYNNLLYYSLEIARIARRYTKIKINKEIVGSIEFYLNKLREKINIEDSENIETLDTFAKAYHFLGNREELARVLNRLIPLANKSLSRLGCDNEIMESILADANAMRDELASCLH